MVRQGASELIFYLPKHSLTKMTLLFAACVNLAGSFNIIEVSLQHTDAHVFAAKTRVDAPPQVWILDGYRIRIYPANAAGHPTVINLPEGSSALDIADIDGDGLNEIIVIVGNQILKIATNTHMGKSEPEVLFALETALSEGARRPYLHVLAVPIEDRLLLALPRNQQFELRTVHGNLVTDLADQADLRTRPSAGTVFSTATLNPVQAAPEGAIEFAAVASTDIEPDLPDSLSPLLAPVDSATTGMTAQVRAARLDAPGTWPQFNLTTDGLSGTTVRYAFTGPHAENTAIRMAISTDSPGRDEEQAKEIRFTSERRYPGNLVFHSIAPPDLNGDGYVDLFLWKAPLPGVSIDSFIKSAESGTWPIRFSIHLYAIKKGYYSGKSTQAIETRVPISWFYRPEMGAPIRNLIFQDFDRDGLKDIAFSTDQRTFGLWLHQDGIQIKPDFEAVFPQEISGVALCETMAEVEPPMVVLRGESSLYILRKPDTS